MITFTDRTRCFQKGLEAEKIRLDRDDGKSVLNWVSRLQEKGEILGFKKSSDPPPSDSGLAPGTFVLMIQTEYQREVFRKHGHTFSGIDATHNTTHYENMSLFTVLVRDRWGHG